MIEDECQLIITEEEARKLEDALAGLDQEQADRPAEVRDLLRAAIQSQLDKLRRQIASYSAVRAR